MRNVVFALLACLLGALAASPALADRDEDVFNRIEQLQGNAGDFNDLLHRVKQALLDDDAAALASYANYPLRVDANGESYDILAPQDLVDNYDSLISQSTKDNVANQAYGDLFVNSDGVMLAGGAIWMSAVCDDGACSTSHWAIISINN